VAGKIMDVPLHLLYLILDRVFIWLMLLGRISSGCPTGRRGCVVALSDRCGVGVVRVAPR